MNELQCSARGCRSTADWALLWNNPRIHAPQRRKIWLACAAHLEHLREYLEMRELLDRVVPVTEIPEGAG